MDTKLKRPLIKSDIKPSDLIYFELRPLERLIYWVTEYMPKDVIDAEIKERKRSKQKAKNSTSEKVYAVTNENNSRESAVALLKVIWKLLSSGSKLNSVFVLQLDDLLNKLAEVADKGGVLILKVSLGEDGLILVEDEVQVGKKSTGAKKTSK